MTLINLLSSYIYSKGLSKKEKIQLYGIAVIFLILLYNSPAGLVLYWTGNNLFSLGKNILQKTKYAQKIIYGISSVLLIIVSIYVLFLHDGSLIKRTAVCILSVFILCIPIIKKLISKINILFKDKKFELLKLNELNITKVNFLLSLTGIFLLIGLVTPSNLINSSVSDFSFINPFDSPLPYIGITVMQSLGFSLLIFLLYLLFDKRIKIILTLFITLVFMIFIFNTISFSKEYGIMKSNLVYDIIINLKLKQGFLNAFILIILCAVFYFLFLIKNKIVLLSIQIILVVTLFTYGLYNVFEINKEFNTGIKNTNANVEKIYTLSKSGKNVVVLMIDSAFSGFFPYILNEKPELNQSLKGFVYYPNTIGPGRNTVLGLPTIFGGYYYSPYEMQKRKDQLQDDKFNEAFQIMPRLFANNNYNVYINNFPYFTKSNFSNYSNIEVINNKNIFTDKYLDENTINILENNKVLYKNLIRFSLYKASPVLLHNFLYDNGNYLSINQVNKISYLNNIIENYSYLYYLPTITDISDTNENNFLLIYSGLTHDATFFSLPDYKPSDNIITKREEIYKKDGMYDASIATYLLLAKWFDFLAENKVYDNTRIIIISDHGSPYIENFPDDLQLPHDRWLTYYNTILLVKDFYSDDIIKTDNKFMTSSDIPHLATENLINNIINPVTGQQMFINKDNGYIITSSMEQTSRLRLKYSYNINNNEWLIVRDNIFDRNNWSVYSSDFLR